MKRNAKTIEETSKYKIVVENRFDNIPLTFKIWKNRIELEQQTGQIRHLKKGIL